MPETTDGVGPLVVDAFDGGFGWLAHPAETLARCSHALRTDDGLWLLDSLDAPGLDAVLAGCRKRFPRMLLERGPQSVRELVAAVRR